MTDSTGREMVALASGARVGPAATGVCGGILPLVEALGWDEFAVRAENGRRIVREHGVSLGVSSRAGWGERPWEVDFLPLLIGPEAWAELSAGLVQRVRLLNGMLADLYGVQRLVRDGFLPAPLVQANPGYWRACQALRVPGDVYLHTYAADLVLGEDGAWRVVADRTQTPSGMGFALECRTVTARVLPEAIRELQPRTLADTMQVRRDTLCGLAPERSENPCIVLLTPGSRHEAYFEHAYLARLLGFALTEGDDLTVRDRRVFLKTLDGLRKVDVILRRVADGYCDPLELRGDSLLGVPGLVEALRAGRVAIANGLGTGMLESPAFLPFLPGLCRHLLGEELRLTSVPTWWCGQRRSAEHVERSGDTLGLWPAWGELSGTLALGEARWEAMRSSPHEWVAQEQLRPAEAPVWAEGRLASRPWVLRLFVVHDGGGYRVLPGGLASWVDLTRQGPLSMSLEGPCKDVWVLPDGSDGGGLAPAHHGPVTLAGTTDRGASDLPSRTADHFFWLGRYTERLEQVVRVARCVVGRLADDTGPGSEGRLAALSRLTTHLVGSPAALVGAARGVLQREMLLMLYHEDRGSGVRDLLGRIHQAGFAVRYRLSADTWRILMRLEPAARRSPGRLPLVQAAATLNELVLDLAALSGMEMENMMRGHGWVFLDLGRRLERGLGLVRLLEAMVRCVDELELVLEPGMEMADSVMTYRRLYLAQPRLEGALDLLLWEAGNPRSVAFQVARLREHARGLPDGLNPEAAAGVRERVTALAERLEAARRGVAGAAGGALESGAVTGVLTAVSGGLAELSDQITQVYFSHVLPRLS